MVIFGYVHLVNFSLTFALPFGKVNIMERKYNASYVSRLKTLKKYTLDPELAIWVARQSGLKPIEHISPRVRAEYLKAHPRLGKAVK